MTYFDNGFARLYQADARHLPIPDSSVDCVVTSPPYWGLRDYGLGEWVGGDADCHHKRIQGDISKSTAGYNANTNHAQEPWPNGLCGRCGAEEAGTGIGLEPTPEAYCANMFEVFREVWRVLKPTGTVWLNLGDSYTHSQPGRNRNGTGGQIVRPYGETERVQKGDSSMHSGLKPKDLVGIPWRVAFALQADGWYLRSDIIWSKPNPMPESVTDRPTKAHEYVFLLTKSPRYYYDADAIREPSITPADGRGSTEERKRMGHPSRYGDTEAMASRGDGFTMPSLAPPEGGRNKRSVWEIATQPYPEAHFATFPEKLVEPCIMAGCPQDGVVLDPFAGSGTTLAVAQRLGRKSIGIDLSEDYLKLASKRLGAIPMPMILA